MAERALARERAAGIFSILDSDSGGLVARRLDKAKSEAPRGAFLLAKQRIAFSEIKRGKRVNETFETISGVKVVALVFGFIGAALGISYTPEITKRTAFAALIAGVVCGGLGPEGVQAMFTTPLPMVIKNVIALICGVGGMFIVPGLITAWKGFATDPWAFIDRLRGLRNDKKDGGQQ